MVTTATELPGHGIIGNLGVVRGIVVRSRSVFGSIGAAFQKLVGGNITIYTRLCEQTRQDTYNMMVAHATEIIPGVTEVLCYGTAVMASPRE